MCSGLVMTSNTKCRGASNTRVIAISRSDGGVIFSVLSTLVSTLPLLLCSNPGSFPRRLGRLFGFHFLQIAIEPFEILVPEPAEVSQPAIDLLERSRVDAAWAPLRLPPARDQAGMFQHLEMFRDRRKAHVKGFGQFRYRRLAERPTRQNRAPRRIGQCRECHAEGVERHRYLPIG